MKIFPIVFLSGIVLFAFKLKLQAQNLVPNPSFENAKTVEQGCDWDHTGIEKEQLKHWEQRGSVDLWSLDHKVDCEQHPSKARQMPYRGKNYLGFSPRYIGDSREFAFVKLREPLVPGQLYAVKMYVSLADFSDEAINSIGILFTNEYPHPVFGYEFKGSKPQIVEESIITDTANWQLVSECYIADSAYQYLTIGNFSAEGETKWIEIENPYERDRVSLDSYYYFDEISVEATIPPPEPVQLPADTFLCVGSSFTIDVSQKNATYIWQDGSTEPVHTIDEAGYYSVEIRRGKCASTSDNFRLHYWPQIKLESGVRDCEQTEIILRAQHPAENYRWNTGESSNEITVRQSGLYWVEVETPDCTFRDSIQVDMDNCISGIPNFFTPNGDGINETFFVEGLDYNQWQLDIYNRWGKLVYSKFPYRNNWKAEGVSRGVYYYFLKNKDSNQVKKGWVRVKK